MRDFVDYREYLAALVSHHKNIDRSFSYRGFARKAGLASPNYLQQVISRNRNLAPASVPAFAKGFGMSRADARIFQFMVEFDAARTDDEKNQWCDRLLDHERGHARRKAVSAHRQWYPLVIREMAALPGFQPDPAWVAPRLRPAITEAQARRALELLFDAGLLLRAHDGAVRPGPGEALEPPLAELAARNAERSRGQLVSQTLNDRLDTVRSLSLRLTPSAVSAANAAIDRLIGELEALVAADGEAPPAEIHTLAVALFPVTATTDLG
ncbi:MAG: TIGR02147 family protein [Deltaproteobacteria bacterium]|nr:TIGR02147 family protein [Deltaproteobacteria bacterium]